MRVTVVLIVACLALSCVRASAQDLKLPTGVFLTAAAADWSSTAYCTSNVHCGEANPLFAWAKQPIGTGGMVALGGAADVLIAFGLNKWGRHHHRLATVALYASSVFRVGLAVNNTRIGAMVRGWPTPAPACPPQMFCRIP